MMRDVVWSAAGSPHDAWQQYSVEATAAGDRLTVFTSANFGVPNVNQCRQFMDTWYDQAELVAVSAPPATQPPAPRRRPPAATPTALTEPSPEVVPTEVAQALPTEEPQQPAEPTLEPAPEPSPASGGTICVNAFHDENANGLLDATEGYMAGVTLIVASESAVVGQAISPGTETPACFQSLPAGNYQVAQQVPARLQMTTAANAVVPASGGRTVTVAFGSMLRQNDAPAAAGPGTAGEATAAASATMPAETGASAPGTGPDLLAYSGFGVLLLGLLLLGLLLFFFLRR